MSGVGGGGFKLGFFLVSDKKNGKTKCKFECLREDFLGTLLVGGFLLTVTCGCVRDPLSSF